MGELAVIDRSGDTKLMWDKNNQDEVDAAAATFKSLKAKGYIAYSVKGKNGEKDQVIRDFDPDAERIILAPAMAGG